MATGSMAGAELHTLYTLAHTTFQQQHDALNTLIGALDKAIHESEGYWMGPNAKAFVGDWDTKAKPAFTNFVQALEQAMKDIDSNGNAIAAATGGHYG